MTLRTQGTRSGALSFDFTDYAMNRTTNNGMFFGGESTRFDSLCGAKHRALGAAHGAEK